MCQHGDKEPSFCYVLRCREQIALLLRGSLPESWDRGCFAYSYQQNMLKFAHYSLSPNFPLVCGLRGHYTWPVAVPVLLSLLVLNTIKAHEKGKRRIFSNFSFVFFTWFINIQIPFKLNYRLLNYDLVNYVWEISITYPKNNECHLPNQVNAVFDFFSIF